MGNPLYNMFTNMMMNRVIGQGQSFPPGGGGGNTPNIYQQIQMLQRDTGAILDILAMSGKINQQQYSELQPYKNDPQKMVQYLINNGRADEIGKAQQDANNLLGNYRQDTPMPGGNTAVN